MYTKDSRKKQLISHAPVAQRNRAPVFGTGGRGFESLRACHFLGKDDRTSLNVFILARLTQIGGGYW